MASVNMDREAVATQRSHAPQKLTEDEERVLRQCSKEAFLYRSIPFGAAFLAGTVWAGKMGYLKPGGTRAAITSAGLVFCYVAGNVSYASQCRQKIQTLIPDSNLARKLREKFADKSSAINQESPAWNNDHTRKKVLHRFNPEEMWQILETVAEFVPDQSPTYFPSQEASGKDLYSEEIHSGRQAPGLDDSLRPTIDNNVIGISRKEEQPKDDRASITYEELRKRNREGHRNRRSSLSGIPTDQSEDSRHLNTPPGQKEPGFFDKNVTRKKNEYGDDWED